MTPQRSHIPLNNFTLLWEEIRQEAVQAFIRVGESAWYILGKEVEAFEEELARMSELPFAVGCANGLDAIEIGLRILGITPGQKVITTPQSAFATSLAIVRAGGVPVFVDVDSSGLLDLEKAKVVLQSDPSIKYMVPVHLFGHVLNLRRLAELRDQFDLKIVEDAAQAVLGKSNGDPVGTAGQVTATSFYPTKNLGCIGDGGAVFLKDSTLSSAAKSLRDYGQSKKYVHDEVGLNSRLDEVQAAILRSALLPHLRRFTDRRSRIAALYNEGIRHDKVQVIPTPPHSESVWHLYPVIVNGDRENFRAHLASAGIATGIHYPIIIPEQAALQAKGMMEVHGDLTEAKRIATREVSIPIHPYLKDEEVQRVIDACVSWKAP